MPDYLYDVFLSVKDHEVFNEWVRDTFLPLFKGYLGNDIIELCHRPALDVFYYGKNLRPGDPWPDELREGIRSSRLALALCSPEYFWSKWCLTEFQSFLDRAQALHSKLLVPVSIHDGKGFPDTARNLQIADLSRYVVVGHGFRDTKRYLSFQDEVKALSRRVAELIALAPPFQEFEVVETHPPGAAPPIAQKTISS